MTNSFVGQTLLGALAPLIVGVAVIIAILFLLYKFSKLKSFVTILSMILFILLIPGFAFLSLAWIVDGYDRTILVLGGIGIALFIAILGYAIHTKTAKKYLKWLFGFWGTIIGIIIAYVAIAILTHDPIVPRPLTVHQLLTGYNIVYTHDGKLYQNDEYIMDLENIFGDEELECHFCFEGQVDQYGYLYINKGYETNGRVVNIATQEVDAIREGTQESRHQRSIWPILHMPRTFYNNNNLYIDNKVLEGHKLIVSNNTGFLTHYNGIKDVWIDGPAKEHINSYYWYNYGSTGYIEIDYDSLMGNLVSIISGSVSKQQILGVKDGLPVIKLSYSHGETHIIQGKSLIASGAHNRATIFNNDLYIRNDEGDIYKDGDLIISGTYNNYNDEGFIMSDVCNIGYMSKPILCAIDGLFYDVNKIPFYYQTMPEVWFNFVGIGISFGGFTLFDRGFISTFGYTGDYKQKKGFPLVNSYNKYIQTVLGYWYVDIRESNKYSRKTLFKSVSDHYLNTDTIFLRPFHEDGLENSQPISLISGIDNFLGIYPITPPESNDPNANINIGQLIIDTYINTGSESVLDNTCMTIVSPTSGSTITFPLDIEIELRQDCSGYLFEGTAGTAIIQQNNISISDVDRRTLNGVLEGRHETDNEGIVFPTILTATISTLTGSYSTGDAELIISLNNPCGDLPECPQTPDPLHIPVYIEDNETNSNIPDEERIRQGLLELQKSREERNNTNQ